MEYRFFFVCFFLKSFFIIVFLFPHDLCLFSPDQEIRKRCSSIRILDSIDLFIKLYIPKCIVGNFLKLVMPFYL